MSEMFFGRNPPAHGEEERSVLPPAGCFLYISLTYQKIQHVMHRLNVLFAIVVALGLLLAGCDSSSIQPENHSKPPSAEGPTPNTSSLAKSGGSFSPWYQGFEQNTEGWITDEISGPSGWCGDVAQQGSDDGPVEPSLGSGYAVVEHGACNDYWSENGFADGSGPYAPVAYTDGPTGDHMIAVDIYLDPRMSGGTTFLVSASVRLLDQESPYRYFFVPVTKKGRGLFVAGRQVPEPGWYTFRFRFTDDAAGNLSAKFQLVEGFRALRQGLSEEGDVFGTLPRRQVLFTKQLTKTALTGEKTSSFSVSNVGNGYLWFVSIAEGLKLPIDQHQVRRRPIKFSAPELSARPSTLPSGR